jgi:YbbR domain-containing protein
MRQTSFIYRLFDRWPVKIICIALAIVLYILFRVNTLTERQLTIPLRVLIPEGFVVSSEYPGSINVTLRGEEDELKGILPDDIDAFVDLTPYPEEGEYQIPVEFRKKGSALQPEALELRPRPRDITLSQERRTVRSFIVRPELSGFPALGYELTQFFISPSSVTAVGPQSQLAKLTDLKTELIDLSGRRNDFTVTTRIMLPSSQIEIPGGQIVEFRGVVDESVVIRTIAEREVVIFDLPEGLRIDEELPTVSLTVQGSQLTVEGSKPQDMTFYIDGSAISRPGTYVLLLKMDIPTGLAVLQLLPREVTIRVVSDVEVTP